MKFISILTALLLLSSLAFGQNKKDKVRYSVKVDLIETCNYQDQTDRKAKSIAFCELNKIPTIKHLPCIDSESFAKIRTKEEIVNRALALCYLGLKSEGLEKEGLTRFDSIYNVRPHFSPDELAYVNSKGPTQQQIINANWRYESLHVLLWSLGFINELKFPDEMCNVGNDVRIIYNLTREEFFEGAKLKSIQEILDANDLIYRLHWASTDARINNKKMPAKMDGSVIYERHYVLNWLIHYMDADWDDVSTNT